METNTILKKDASMLEAEIKSLENLIEKRRAWLIDPTNQMRGTYKAVKQDTVQLEQDLADLKFRCNGL